MTMSNYGEAWFITQKRFLCPPLILSDILIKFRHFQYHNIMHASWTWSLAILPFSGEFYTACIPVIYEALIETHPGVKCMWQQIPLKISQNVFNFLIYTKICKTLVYRLQIWNLFNKMKAWKEAYQLKINKL